MLPQDRDVLSILESGDLEVNGEFVWGSNYTFLVKVAHENSLLQGVYKPTKGEIPLWDFPGESLAMREVAAYIVSQEIGWNFVPPTVYRDNAPFGPGSLQLFIDHDPEYHYFTLSRVDKEKLRTVALFDVLINNADRKGSHIIRDSNSKLWLIDHGVSFHIHNKLRTVIWDFVGEPISEDLCEQLTMFHQRLISSVKSGSELFEILRKYLSSEEIDALSKRALQLIQSGMFPSPDPHRRHYPWPQL